MNFLNNIEPKSALSSHFTTPKNLGQNNKVIQSGKLQGRTSKQAQQAGGNNIMNLFGMGVSKAFKKKHKEKTEESN